MKFIGTDFSCDVTVFRDGADLVAKFYDKAREHQPAQLRNLVVADPGYGYLCLKAVGPDALLTGFLDEAVFSSEVLIHQAIEVVESLLPNAAGAYIPHHIRLFRSTGCVEYNGEQ